MSNTQKKCAEGAVVNLLIQLNFQPEDVDEFWRLSFLPIDNIMFSLGEKNIPKKVQSAAGAVNSLTAIDGHDRQYFNELRSTIVSCRIFIRSQSLIAR